MRAVGMRYITVQVRDVDADHRRFMSMGVWEGAAPVSLGAVARISFIRDPDGNFIEISQRASLTGPIPGEPATQRAPAAAGRSRAGKVRSAPAIDAMDSGPRP